MSAPVDQTQPIRVRRAENPKFLVLGLITLFLVSPALQGLTFATLITSTLFTFIYASAVVGLRPSRLGMYIILGLGLMFVALLWANSLLQHAPILDLAERFLTAAFLGALIVSLLHSVITATRVTENTLWHAIGCYLLLGLAWSSLYRAVVHIDPTAIRGLKETATATSADFVYFSFTCLTTLGFGDILPVSPYARTLVLLEAVVGPLYLAIVIAKLVALYRTPAESEGSD